MYRTSDLHLSAFLKTRSHNVTAESKGRKWFFLFADSERLQEDIFDYFNNGEVKALDFKDAVQNLKTWIFSSKE